MYSCCVQLFLHAALAAVARAAFTLDNLIFVLRSNFPWWALDQIITFEQMFVQCMCISLSTPFKDRYGSHRYTLLGLFIVLSITALVSAVGKEISQRGPDHQKLALYGCDELRHNNPYQFKLFSDMSGWCSHMTLIDSFQTCQGAQNGKLLQQNLTSLRSRSLT